MICINESLPNEIKLEIFKKLDPRTLAKIERVCTGWKALIDANPWLWKERLAHLYPGIDINRVINPKLVASRYYLDKSKFVNDHPSQFTYIAAGLVELIPFGGVMVEITRMISDYFSRR